MPTKAAQYLPDYATPPGHTLAEILENKGLSTEAFAKKCGVSTEVIDAILDGSVPITDDMALIFEEIFGINSSFWINLERNYRETLVRLEGKHAN